MQEKREHKGRVDWSTDNLDQGQLTHKRSKISTENINQQVLDELVEFERQCMGFFDDDIVEAKSVH